MVKAHKKYAERCHVPGCQMLETIQNRRSVVRKHKVTFPFLMDPNGEIYPRWRRESSAGYLSDSPSTIHPEQGEGRIRHSFPRCAGSRAVENNRQADQTK